jgi:hypothetical protein
MRRRGHDIMEKSTNLETVIGAPYHWVRPLKIVLSFLWKGRYHPFVFRNVLGIRRAFNWVLEWPENGSDSPRYLRHESSHDHEYCR